MNANIRKWRVAPEPPAGAIPQQTFQTIALVGLDVYLCIDREAAAVFPLGHHMRIVCRQQPAPQGRAQQSSLHGDLNLADCRRIQTAGWVKAGTTSRIAVEHAMGDCHEITLPW